MAVAFEAMIYNGQRCKVVRFSDLDNAAANEIVATWVTTCGATNFQGTSIPAEIGITITTSTDIATMWAVTAVSNTGFTLRHLANGAGGAGGTVKVAILFRVPRGIAG